MQPSSFLKEIRFLGLNNQIIDQKERGILRGFKKISPYELSKS
jgi:hypothetical protein